MQSANLQLVQVSSTESYCRLRPHESLPHFDARMLLSHPPDAHWVVASDDQLTARCSLWWRRTPNDPQRKIGVIGHYAAADDDSAAALLEVAAGELASSGCTFALGPMNQNTWRDYRFVTMNGGHPAFFMEPTNPPQWPEQFARAGFREISWYFSAVVEDLTIQSSRLDRVRRRMAERGVRIRQLCREQFESDLKQIYAVARVAFAKRLFYDSISEAEFLALYRPLQQTIPTDLIQLAEQSGKVIGFCFAMPDLLQSARGLPIDTAIIKTFAVLPHRQNAGLGQVLLEETQQRAAMLGFRRGIHALVEEGGHVQKISERYAVPARRYALFAKELSR